ncbi:MAG: aminoglycoside phosphotransferase family protein [Bacteroidales bacterium]|nr:aminoglycoside phosphotransferase family protein [Bacteroidales bacterium]
MSNRLNDIIRSFGIDPSACNTGPLGKGHIHDTYLVDRCQEHPPLILQCMNHHVFKDIELLMRNMEVITSHIADKNRIAGIDPACSGIVLLETDEGKSWIGNSEEGYWRMFWYIEDQISYEVAPNPDVAYQGGLAIARFQGMLSDLDPDRIGDSIPRFHDLRMRIDQFMDALSTGVKKRKGVAADMIGLSEKYMHRAMEVYEFSDQGNVPVRLTHNDTKFNNILFHKSSGKSNCMIDLDTVMKGYSWFDIGDALRTCASVAPEDEPDTSKIDFRIEIFEGFTKGYLAGSSGFLTADERKLLHRAPAVFAYTQGLRFLTDYLNGDTYYKTEFETHNYQRARAQYTLMEKMIKRENEMADIVD